MLTNLRHATLYATLFFLASASMLAQLPAGTMLPVELNSTLDSNHDKAGQRITASLRQDVPLPDRGRIPKHSQVSGHIVAVSRAAGGNPARLVFEVDQIEAAGRQLKIATNLRALASMLEVHTAELPANQSGFDTTVWNWKFRFIGDEVGFTGSMTVRNQLDQVVGRMPEPGVVLGKARSDPEQGCSNAYDNEFEQAFWLFSTDACGLYGLKDMMQVKPDPGQPETLVTLSHPKRVLVRGGSAMLLEVMPEKTKPPR